MSIKILWTLCFVY